MSILRIRRQRLRSATERSRIGGAGIGDRGSSSLPVAAVAATGWPLPPDLQRNPTGATHSPEQQVAQLPGARFCEIAAKVGSGLWHRCRVSTRRCAPARCGSGVERKGATAERIALSWLVSLPAVGGLVAAGAALLTGRGD